MLGNKKILILGAKGIPKVYCYDWNDKSLPNIPDYDIVIINVVSLTKKARLEFPVQNLIRKGLNTLLDTKGILVAIGFPIREIATYPKKGRERESAGFQSNYSWCPVSINITNESGTSFEFNGSFLKEYFKHMKRWSYYFELPDKHKNYPLGIKNFVRNRYSKYLAGVINYSVPEVGWKSGDFIFLPCPTEITDIEAINFVLEKFFNIYQETPPPEWTGSIEVPNLKDIEENIATKNKLIKQLSEDTEKLQKKMSELISYRKLLYESGTALEEIVRKVFTMLGYKPKPPVFKEEYTVEYDKKVGIIECKGNEKSIKRDDFRQLLEHTKEYDLDGKFEYKGLLIGNAWRLKPLEERNKNGTPIFPKGQNGVIDVATRHDIALVSTIDLFKAFCNFLEGKIKPDDIMKRIFSAKGIFDFNK